MKAYLSVLLFLPSTLLYGQGASQVPTSQKKTQQKEMQQQETPKQEASKEVPLPKEPKKNIDYLFYDNMDPEYVLKDMIPQFVRLSDIDNSAYQIETVGTLYKEGDSPQILLPAFLYYNEIEALGTVEKGFNGENSIAPLNKVYIKLKKDLRSFASYSILRLAETIKDSESRSWYFYEYVGDVDALDYQKGDRILVQTLNSTHAQTGDFLVPLVEAKRVLKFQDGMRRPFKESAEILTFKDTQISFAGRGDLVYLNKGFREGVVLDQVLDIFDNPDKNTDDGQRVLPTVIGTVQIIDIAPHSSTAYILNASKEIHKGDLVKNTD